MKELEIIKRLETVTGENYPDYEVNRMLPQQIECTMGYEPLTDLWRELSVAETKGYDELKTFIEKKDTEWRSDHKRYTELSLFLNWKIWEWHGRDCDAYGRLYNNMWETVDGWAMDNLTGDAASYYIRTTD